MGIGRTITNAYKTVTNPVKNTFGRAEQGMDDLFRPVSDKANQLYGKAAGVGESIYDNAVSGLQALDQWTDPPPMDDAALEALGRAVPQWASISPSGRLAQLSSGVGPDPRLTSMTAERRPSGPEDTWRRYERMVDLPPPPRGRR